LLRQSPGYLDSSAKEIPIFHKTQDRKGLISLDIKSPIPPVPSGLAQRELRVLTVPLLGSMRFQAFYILFSETLKIL
jgi:hypothetical protein